MEKTRRRLKTSCAQHSSIPFDAVDSTCQNHQMPLNLVVHLVPSKDAFVALPPDVVDQIFAANEVRTL